MDTSYRDKLCQSMQDKKHETMHCPGVFGKNSSVQHHCQSRREKHSTYCNECSTFRRKTHPVVYWRKKALEDSGCFLTHQQKTQIQFDVCYEMARNLNLHITEIPFVQECDKMTEQTESDANSYVESDARSSVSEMISLSGDDDHDSNDDDLTDVHLEGLDEDNSAHDLYNGWMNQTSQERTIKDLRRTIEEQNRTIEDLKRTIESEKRKFAELPAQKETSDEPMNKKHSNIMQSEANSGSKKQNNSRLQGITLDPYCFETRRFF